MTRTLAAVPDLGVAVPRSAPLLWAACCAGREPAESLDPRDREDLVANLLAVGWPLASVAAHCRMSLYTTARIAERVRWQSEPAEHARNAS